VTNHINKQHYIISNAKLHEKHFLEIFQKNIEGGIEITNKFNLIFPIEKREKSGLINFPPTHSLQTNTTHIISVLMLYVRKKLKYLQYLNFPW
jgi:hypothetical protein